MSKVKIKQTFKKKITIFWELTFDMKQLIERFWLNMWRKKEQHGTLFIVWIDSSCGDWGKSGSGKSDFWGIKIS